MIKFIHVHKDLQGNIITEAEHTVYDSDLNETMQAFRLFLLAIGYHPESVDREIEPE